MSARGYALNLSVCPIFRFLFVEARGPVMVGVNKELFEIFSGPHFAPHPLETALFRWCSSTSALEEEKVPRLSSASRLRDKRVLGLVIRTLLEMSSSRFRDHNDGFCELSAEDSLRCSRSCNGSKIFLKKTGCGH